jgi:hypothetical protein
LLIGNDDRLFGASLASFTKSFSWFISLFALQSPGRELPPGTFTADPARTMPA